ncbi:ParM/StbA family protein [Pararhizobium sp. BT-229]|uniref:ParM/StbA family protein n=1 Tax=Pararhizobium sp. BT-229 TaxID=2986923 RepID=UPI0021F77574|nr:ParM/StbA family protein [Pararhizobium sp. BT-229]MCV9964381.1 ParM/StbA family protein [Pararhizobium sp. BT-229]
MSNTDSKLLVAVDDGYAQTKLYTVLPDGTEVKQVRRSSIRTGKEGIGSINGDGFVGLYEVDGVGFTVSELIESENTQFDGFHTSVLDRVLVNHALVEANLGDAQVSLWTGLPVSDYFRAGKKDDDKIAAKRANLLKPVKSGAPDVIIPTITDVKVGCQAVSAWIDFAMNDNLELRDDIDGAIAIVDIGGRTTDIATVIGGQNVDHRRSGTDNIGMLDVYAGLQHGIAKKFDVRGGLPIGDLARAMRNPAKTIKLWGKERDISEIIDEVLAEYQGLLTRAIERVIGNGASIDKVVFVGGGSALFTGLREKFPHNGETVDDPEFANARGLHKYARYQAQLAAQGE